MYKPDRYFKFNFSDKSNDVVSYYKTECVTDDTGTFYNTTSENAGIDLFVPTNITIKPQEKWLIDLEISIELVKGLDNQAFLLMPRSSFGKTTLQMCNSVGLIDKGYRGTLRGLVYNYGPDNVEITRGDRLFQIVSHDLASLPYCIVDELSTSIRGSGGFGSTGK